MNIMANANPTATAMATVTATTAAISNPNSCSPDATASSVNDRNSPESVTALELTALAHAALKWLKEANHYIDRATHDSALEQ